MQDWPHQILATENVLAAIKGGERRICLTAPTGAGKTRIAEKIIKAHTDEMLRVVLYSNRKALISQLSTFLTEAGITHGIRAGTNTPQLWKGVQISSMQTENSRVLKGDVWEGLHDAHVVLVDESHLQDGPVARAILERHIAGGAAVVGLTATPVDLGWYTKLIVAATNSELRACGALVKALHYSPDEPDMVAWKRKLKLVSGKDPSENQQKKIMMTPGIFGRVFDSFEKLNPQHKPSILFGPGVGESLWFAEQFVRRRVSAAHIDGANVWINGHMYKNDEQARKDVLDGSKSGRIVVLCNRFVLREGIDAPWLCHGVFASVYGALSSYLQSGGRLLRYYPGIEVVTIQDHGGNWHRFGSLNADRTWHLDLSNSAYVGMLEDEARAHPEKVPTVCPRCGLVLAWKTCSCGFEVSNVTRSRPVVQEDGTLKEMTGDIHRPHRITQRRDGQKIWSTMYWRSKSYKKGRTFKQAAALFAQENNWGWPDPRWPLMPLERSDWFRLVRDVPMERLRSSQSRT